MEENVILHGWKYTVRFERSRNMTVQKSIKNLDDLYELTLLQEDVLQRYINSPGEGLFHENLLFRFEGKIDISIFKLSWEKVIARHPILRTSFHYKELNKPIQVVHREVEIPLEVMDWSNLTSDEQETKLVQLTEEDLNCEYVLERAPLMRLTLIQCGRNTYLFWWRFHHILMDGWGFSVALNDFLSFYRAYYHEKGKLQLEPTAPYREYVAWLKNRDTANERAFWNKYMQDFIPPEPLILKSPKKKLATKIRQGKINYDISELFEPVQELIKQHEITLNAVFQGIFLLVMSRYNGHKLDMITGTTVADRPLGLRYSHNRVGLYINALPTRFIIDPKSKFVDWVKKLQPSILELYQYSSSAERDIKRYCDISNNKMLFESNFIFENTPLPSDPFAGLGFRQTEYRAESRSYYPIAVYLWPLRDMNLKMVYDQQRFAKDAANTVLIEIKNVLEAFLNNPQLKVESVF